MWGSEAKKEEEEKESRKKKQRISFGLLWGGELRSEMLPCMKNKAEDSIHSAKDKLEAL